MADSTPHGAKHLPLDISMSRPESDTSNGTNIVPQTAEELVDFDTLDNGGLVAVAPSHHIPLFHLHTMYQRKVKWQEKSRVSGFTVRLWVTEWERSSVCSFLFYSLLFYSCLLLFYKTLLFYSSVCPSFWFCSCLVKSSSKIPGSSAWNGFSVPLDLDCTIPPHCSVEVYRIYHTSRTQRDDGDDKALATAKNNNQKTTIN